MERIFWGVSSSPANTEAFIEALANSAEATAHYSRTFTVTASGGNKVYFAAPDQFGAVTFLNVADSVAGGFIVRASGISVTDSIGTAQLYTLYESTLAGLGLITIQASW